MERQVGERRRWKEELEKSRIEMEHQVEPDDNQTKHKRIQTTQTYKKVKKYKRNKSRIGMEHQVDRDDNETFFL